MATSADSLSGTFDAIAIESELEWLYQAGWAIEEAGYSSESSDAQNLGRLIARSKAIVHPLAAALGSAPTLYHVLVDAITVERHPVTVCLQVQAGYAEPEVWRCC